MIFTPYGLPEMGEAYLAPTYFLDSDVPVVVDFAKRAAAGETDPSRIAVKLFYAVRDEFRYDPFAIWLAPEKFQASIVVKQGYGSVSPRRCCWPRRRGRAAFLRRSASAT
jgi:transglutaminase-like putative cysteine protease